MSTSTPKPADSLTEAAAAGAILVTTIPSERDIDYVPQDDDHEEFQERQAQALLLEEEEAAQAEVEEAAEKAITDALRLFRINKDLRLPPMEWLINGLVPVNSLTSIIGQAKLGKSWVALDMAICVATGRDFLTNAVAKPGTVFYYMAEGNKSQMVDRIDALLRSRGLDRDALGDRFLMSLDLFDMETERTKAAIAYAIKELEPAMIIFDPMVRFLSGADENSVTEMRKVINWWVGLAKFTNVVVVHHTGKDGKTARGTSDFLGMVDTQILLKGKPGSGTMSISIVQRNAEAPEPFDVTLDISNVEGTKRIDTATLKLGGTSAPEVKAPQRLNEKSVEKVRRFLATQSGRCTVADIQKLLEVRFDTAKGYLESVGATYVNRQWFLPANPPHEERIAIEALRDSTPKG